jgi:hypothetical protein
MSLPRCSQRSARRSTPATSTTSARSRSEPRSRATCLRSRWNPPPRSPFAPLPRPLADLTLALISAGGVFAIDDDPMGPDGPSQQESLSLIHEFLRGTPTLSTIPVDTPNQHLTARHPGYDARSAQRDPSAVFPLDHLRDLAGEGRVQLADEHYGFTGATSQRRLGKQVAPRWAEHMAAREVDVVFLVAT